MADALTAREFATTLRFDKGRLDLDDFAMRIAGGGRPAMRRCAAMPTM